MKYSLLAVPIIALLLQCCQTNKGSPLPEFKILLLDSITILNTSQIPQGKAFILMYFSPDCDHCQRETKELLKHMEKLKDTKFYFITSNRLSELKEFNNEYKLTSFPNVTVGRDYQLFIMRTFKDATPPYLVIYDKHKIQRAVFAGESNIDQILDILNKVNG